MIFYFVLLEESFQSSKQPSGNCAPQGPGSLRILRQEYIEIPLDADTSRRLFPLVQGHEAASTAKINTLASLRFFDVSVSAPYLLYNIYYAEGLPLVFLQCISTCYIDGTSAHSHSESTDIFKHSRLQHLTDDVVDDNVLHAISQANCFVVAD